MKHPWEDVELSVYEAHMSHANVGQLQALDAMMAQQAASYPCRVAAILGVAGGNGLSHFLGGGFERVIGVDVNADYLKACSVRYADHCGKLLLVRADLSQKGTVLPKADLVIANLFVEYVGCTRFAEILTECSPETVSCAIQLSGGEGFVTSSPHAKAFLGIGSVHRDISRDELCEAMAEAGYLLCFEMPWPLPNGTMPSGKALLQLDFQRL
jgi:hypothetical protein